MTNSETMEETTAKPKAYEISTDSLDEVLALCLRKFREENPGISRYAAAFTDGSKVEFKIARRK